MSLIVSQKKKIVHYLILIIVLLVLLSTFVIRYHKLNDLDHKLDITENDGKYGEVMAVYNMYYCIKKPTVKTLYDKTYQQSIYRYQIPFELQNISKKGSLEEPVSLETFLSQVFIFSGGDKWQGTVSPKDKNIKWVLKGGEKVQGHFIIDVIPDKKIAKKYYDKFQLYHVSDQYDVIIKDKFGTY